MFEYVADYFVDIASFWLQVANYAVQFINQGMADKQTEKIICAKYCVLQIFSPFFILFFSKIAKSDYYPNKCKLFVN